MITRPKLISERTTELDKAAASRFIKHAISEAQSSQQLQWKKTSAEEDQNDDSSSSEDNESESTTIKLQPIIQPKMTSKMLARQNYEKELREQDSNPNSDEEDVLEVFDQMDVDDGHANVKDKKKGKGKLMPIASPGVPSKRRRPVMDPFAASGLSRFFQPVDFVHPVRNIGFVDSEEEADDRPLSSTFRRNPRLSKSDLPSSEALRPLSHVENEVKRKKKNKNFATSK